MEISGRSSRSDTPTPVTSLRLSRRSSASHLKIPDGQGRLAIDLRVNKPYGRSWGTLFYPGRCTTELAGSPVVKRVSLINTHTMKRANLLFALLFCIASFSAAQDSPEQALIGLENQLLEAIVARNHDALASFSMISSTASWLPDKL